ncbi:uncharacterized protein F5147DRAFT_655749 [Suillus discolor]|uniref:Uncharacterized protein n=1 Tax=Suillus discolor TaxID=1912936 RepID=A0A9P7JQM5_9AGAM|nr:uncharacterized protein F5147DRAFT_655749 [Suillus discolor]KAG2099547.1 hypothetical protein F5147DRAFT_655749 [Suillus discolor]
MASESVIVDGADQVIIHDNVIVMDIENLLTGWLTYEINFTPENLGPLKLIICLKDPVKMVHIEESSDSEVDLLIPGNHKRKKTSSTNRENKRTKTFTTDTIKLAEDLAGLKITSQSSGTNAIKAKPVRLVGLRKNPLPRKYKFDSNITWPPVRRHHFRDVEDKDSIAGLDIFLYTRIIILRYRIDALRFPRVFLKHVNRTKQKLVINNAMHASYFHLIYYYHHASTSSSSDSDDSMMSQSRSTSPPTTLPMHEEPKRKKSLQKRTRESSDSNTNAKKPKKRTKKHKDSDSGNKPKQKGMSLQEQCLHVARWIPQGVDMFCKLTDVFWVAPLVEQ